MIDRVKFFTDVRQSVFHGYLGQSQVDGINTILDAWEASGLTDPTWLAYMLGTAYHETGATMQPIHEYGSTAYFIRMYDIQGKDPGRARSMGNIHPGDGPKYCGRGYVQLTWHDNYKKAGDIIGVDLVNHPQLAMVPENAARIMFEGMTKRDILFGHTSPNGGWTFTGRSLEDYFTDTTEDWINARRIINGLDHAQMIAETAQDFNDALTP